MDYIEFEEWHNFPDAGGLYDQPYEWKRGIEAVRAAKNRHNYEEAVREARYRAQMESEG